MDKETFDKLEKICQAADWHLQQIQNVIPILKEIKEKIEEVKNFQYSQYSKDLVLLKEEVKYLFANPDPDQRVFQYLKQKLILENWPEAVPADYISVTEKEKELRAGHILDSIIKENLENKKFLDLGCGDGLATKQALRQNCNLAVGYDVKPNSTWQNNQKLMYTNNFIDVKEKGPYDVILMYDVLDHCQNPVALLQSAKEVLGEKADEKALTGRIYLRCHPWCSRHGGHLYNQLNKAYIHLIFNNKELERLGLNLEPILEITDPEREYDKIIKEAGLEIFYKDIKTHPVEDFFKDCVAIQQRIKDNFLIKNKEYMPYKTSIEFIDYTLVKKKIEY